MPGGRFLWALVFSLWSDAGGGGAGCGHLRCDQGGGQLAGDEQQHYAVHQRVVVGAEFYFYESELFCDEDYFCAAVGA